MWKPVSSPLIMACLVAVVTIAALISEGQGSASVQIVRGSSTRPADPHAYVLLPHDLPRGYEIGDDSGCGTYPGSVKACVIELSFRWKTPARYGHTATSAVYLFPTEVGARRAFAARSELLLDAASIERRAERAVDLGDEAALIQGRGLNDPATGIVWRLGNIVAAVAVERGNADRALELAHLQQTRLLRPKMPTIEQRRNHPETRLDDPTMKLPVYWLGKSFDPPGPLPAARLADVTVGRGGPGQSIDLTYTGGIRLDTWRPADWAAFKRTRLGRLVWDSPCATKTTVALNGGSIDIYEGYGDPDPVALPCPTRPPDRVVGHIHISGVTITVNSAVCYMCAAAGKHHGAYETVDGMTRIAQSLRLRPRN